MTHPRHREVHPSWVSALAEALSVPVDPGAAPERPPAATLAPRPAHQNGAAWLEIEPAASCSPVPEAPRDR